MNNKTHKLQLQYLAQNQLAKDILVNENFSLIDSCMMVVVNNILNEQPSEPKTGDLIAINSAPTGSWASFAYNFAMFNGKNWNMWPIVVNTVFFSIAHSKIYRRSETALVLLT